LTFGPLFHARCCFPPPEVRRMAPFGWRWERVPLPPDPLPPDPDDALPRLPYTPADPARLEATPEDRPLDAEA
jgi:hypothetical protein